MRQAAELMAFEHRKAQIDLTHLENKSGEREGKKLNFSFLLLYEKILVYIPKKGRKRRVKREREKVIGIQSSSPSSVVRRNWLLACLLRWGATKYYVLLCMRGVLYGTQGLQEVLLSLLASLHFSLSLYIIYVQEMYRLGWHIRAIYFTLQLLKTCLENENVTNHLSERKFIHSPFETTNDNWHTLFFIRNALPSS